MAIPKFYDFYLPILKIANGDEIQLKDAANIMADHFKLSHEERSETVGSGMTRVRSRANWAVIHLTHAGLLERLRRGVYTITQQGQEVLNSKPTSIDRKFLMKFPKYVEFLSRKRESNSGSNEDSTEPDTPQEQIEAAHNEIVSATKDELLTRILEAPPDFFERLIIQLLVNMGYGGSIDQADAHLGKTGDGGVDGVIAEDKLGLDVIYIQAKRYSQENSVGSPDLQKFLGSLVKKGANKGVFATTSSFSKAAQDFVKSVVHRIILVDGEKLTSLMIEHNVGVRVDSVVELKKVDEEFFEE